MKELGKGAHGRVFEGKGGTAIKDIPHRSYGIDNPLEIEILRRIKHPNILEALEFGWSSDNIYIVMPLAIPLEQIKWEDPLPLIYDLISALNYLEELGIYHCDVTPQNLVIHQGRAKLIDFGSARLAISQRWAPQNVLYAPPEVLEGRNFDPRKAQLWAEGMTIIYLLERRYFFKSKDEREALLEDYIKNPTEYMVSFGISSFWIPPLSDLLQPIDQDRDDKELLSLFPPPRRGEFRNYVPGHLANDDIIISLEEKILKRMPRETYSEAFIREECLSIFSCETLLPDDFFKCPSEVNDKYIHEL